MKTICSRCAESRRNPYYLRPYYFEQRESGEKKQCKAFKKITFESKEEYSFEKAKELKENNYSYYSFQYKGKSAGIVLSRYSLKTLRDRWESILIS